MCIVAMFLSRFSRSCEVGCPTSPTQYAAHSGGSVKPIQLRTIMMLPMTLSAPSSLPVITMPATLPLIGAAAGGAVLLVERVEPFDDALHQARTAAPPDRRAEQHDVRGLDLRDEVRPVIFGRLAEAESDRQRRVREAHDVVFTGASARISSRTSDASSPVFDSSGSCFSDAFSASTLRGASDGMTHGKRGLVLYTARHCLQQDRGGQAHSTRFRR